MADREETDPPSDVRALADLEDPLEALFRSHYAVMVRTAALLLDDDHSAEEAVQEAFLSVDRRLPQIAPAARSAYLRRAVINHCRSRLRSGARLKRQPVATREVVDGPEERALVDARQREVIAAIDRLPYRQRECIVLRFYSELSDVEIAEATGLSTGTVKTHLHRARHALAVALEDSP
jgi:RNA polymerase sigma factor (sigma-70 family)